MPEIVRVVGPKHAVELFGVRLVGVTDENGKKLLLTVALLLHSGFPPSLGRDVTADQLHQ